MSTFSKRWADVDETWYTYCMGRGTKVLGCIILNFTTAQRGAIPNLAQSREMIHPEQGAYIIHMITLFTRLLPISSQDG